MRLVVSGVQPARVGLGCGEGKVPTRDPSPGLHPALGSADISASQWGVARVGAVQRPRGLRVLVPGVLTRLRGAVSQGPGQAASPPTSTALHFRHPALFAEPQSAGREARATPLRHVTSTLFEPAGDFSPPVLRPEGCPGPWAPPPRLCPPPHCTAQALPPLGPCILTPCLTPMPPQRAFLHSWSPHHPVMFTASASRCPCALFVAPGDLWGTPRGRPPTCPEH